MMSLQTEVAKLERIIGTVDAAECACSAPSWPRAWHANDWRHAGQPWPTPTRPDSCDNCGGHAGTVAIVYSETWPPSARSAP